MKTKCEQSAKSVLLFIFSSSRDRHSDVFVLFFNLLRIIRINFFSLECLIMIDVTNFHFTRILYFFFLKNLGKEISFTLM